MTIKNKLFPPKNISLVSIFICKVVFKANSINFRNILSIWFIHTVFMSSSLVLGDFRSHSASRLQGIIELQEVVFCSSSAAKMVFRLIIFLYTHFVVVVVVIFLLDVEFPFSMNFRLLRFLLINAL